VLNLTKDKRFATKKISLKIKKSLTTELKANNNSLNFSSIDNTKENEVDLSYFFMIEQNRIGNEDLQFKVTTLDSNIILDKFNYAWNIPHFLSDNQYLNGVNEIYLRVKQSDLLNGINKIILKITNPSSNKNYYKTYEYEKGLPPYGGNCRVEPIEGYSLLTNFSFIAENWISSSKSLIYKIKFENKNKIFFDLSSGGFLKNNFKLDSLPAGNKLILEVIDIQGFSTLLPCNVNVNINKNVKSMESLLENEIDISKKLLLMEIYQTNVNIFNSINKQILEISINMLDNYFENLNSEDFYDNYEKIISTIITITNEKLDNKNIDKLLKILNIIMKYVDSLLNDLNKIEYLFRILDNLNRIAGDQLKSIIFSSVFLSSSFKIIFFLKSKNIHGKILEKFFVFLINS